MKRFDIFIIVLITILFIFDFIILAGLIGAAYSISFGINAIFENDKEVKHD